MSKICGSICAIDTAHTHLEVSWLLHHDIRGEDMQMWLYGTTAGAHWPNASSLKAILRRSSTTIEPCSSSEPLEPHAQECVEFAQAIVDDAPSPVPPEQSLQVISILNGIYQSQEQGGEIRVDGT